MEAMSARHHLAHRENSDLPHRINSVSDLLLASDLTLKRTWQPQHRSPSTLPPSRFCGFEPCTWSLKQKLVQIPPSLVAAASPRCPAPPRANLVLRVYPLGISGPEFSQNRPSCLSRRVSLGTDPPCWPVLLPHWGTMYTYIPLCSFEFYCVGSCP